MKTPFIRPSDMEKVIQVLQMVLRKARSVCQLFYSSLGTCGPSAQTHQLLEDKPTQTWLLPPPATTLIININNSTLTSCIIGNSNYSSATLDNQPLLQGAGLQMHELTKCSCQCGHQVAAQTTVPPPSPDPLGIHIHSSHLNCVVIGDNNSMQVDQTNECYCQGTGTEL
ncbi:uncharacterized protein ACJ7VT_013472 [Polymixia lowei]